MYWFGHVKIMDGIKILTNALHLKLYRKKRMGRKRIRWFNQVVEGVWKRRRFGKKKKKIGKELCGRKIGGFLFFDPQKMKQLLAEEEAEEENEEERGLGENKRKRGREGDKKKRKR
jgi:hypothetical protein